MDLEHWSQFPSFASHKEHFYNDKLSLDIRTSDHVYMRWKVSLPFLPVFLSLSFGASCRDKDDTDPRVCASGVLLGA